MKIPPDFLIKLGVSEDDLDDLAARKETAVLMEIISFLAKKRSEAEEDSKHPRITDRAWAAVIDPMEERVDALMEELKW